MKLIAVFVVHMIVKNLLQLLSDVCFSVFCDTRVPPLSGTEPWHFYFVNGVLNFNLVFVLALFSLPLTALMETLLHRFNGEDWLLFCLLLL